MCHNILSLLDPPHPPTLKKNEVDDSSLTGPEQTGCGPCTNQFVDLSLLQAHLGSF